MKSLIITGPSGVGKGTLIKFLIQKIPQLSLTLSYTTRSPRPSQQNGIHYFFITKQKFMQLKQNHQILQQTQIYGNFYGTSRDHYNQLISEDKIPVFDIDANGVQSLSSILPQSAKLCLIPPSLKVLQDRLRGRKSESQEQIKRRLFQNMEQLKKLKNLKDKTNIYYVQNFQFQLTAFAISKWMKGLFTLKEDNEKNNMQSPLEKQQ